MSNEQQNTRDAAWRQYLEADTVHVPEDALPFVKGYDAGFRDGAASIDRVEIVREAFETLKARIGQAGDGEFDEDSKYYGETVREEMDKYLADI